MWGTMPRAWGQVCGLWERAGGAGISPAETPLLHLGRIHPSPHLQILGHAEELSTLDPWGEGGWPDPLAPWADSGVSCRRADPKFLQGVQPPCAHSRPPCTPPLCAAARVWPPRCPPWVGGWSRPPGSPAADPGTPLDGTRVPVLSKPLPLHHKASSPPLPLPRGGANPGNPPPRPQPDGTGR